MKTSHTPNPEEQKHFIRCECGYLIDMRNLEEVFAHQHAFGTLPIPQWSHSRVIEKDLEERKEQEEI